ncbi:uncharacterized protein LOC130986376 isoform X2 [Salvia miltiorrhiza]|uniref:uncharacterized protein LOC130986376 isoform X2 n=1 Tax=Salvia miltiorrhiza TaxID=226208 RepID=UPI0025ACD132|nr:uncharacterized protein LOC130986376 isoform X2 [Salvia miltiorrhiza]
MLQAITRESKDVSSRLMGYISSCKALHECKSQQYTAECLKKEGKIGVAVRVVSQALSDMKKSMPKEESWKSVFRQVVDDLSAMVRKYEHENDFVWHDKVPCAYEPPSSPQGVKIVYRIPYQPQKWERTLVFKL